MKQECKYIVSDKIGRLGNEIAIMFPFHIQHVEMATKLGLGRDDIISAGFVHLVAEKDGEQRFGVYGHSFSLKKDSREKEDADIINRHYAYLLP